MRERSMEKKGDDQMARREWRREVWRRRGMIKWLGENGGEKYGEEGG
jgi:hypothetical protein